MSRWINRWVDTLIRHPVAILAIAVVVGAVSVFLSTRLHIVQDLKVLLPPDATSIVHLEKLKERMGNQSDLFVSIEGADPEKNKAFGRLLEERLREHPDIRWVVFHRDRSFFDENALLFLNLEELLDLRERVIDRIRREVKRDLIEDMRADGSADTDSDEEDLSEEAIKERYGIDKKMPPYWESEDGRVVVLKARPTQGTTDIAFVKKLEGEVQALIAEFDPEAHQPGMTATVVGHYASRLKEVRSMADDVVLGSIMVFSLLLLFIWLFFRRLRALPLILTPLLLSVFAALAFASLTYGFLNLVSAFIFAILLGLGIDFGVHIYGRYEDERNRGLEQREALRLALGSTGLSTATGACSTAAAFALLSVANFQGFSQFGVVASVGVVFALLGVFTVMPAMVVVFEKRWPWKPRPSRSSVDAPPTRPGGKLVFLATAIVMCAGLFMMSMSNHVDGLAFEYDFRNLGVKKEQREKTPWEVALGKENTLAPAVAVTENLEQTRQTHRQLAAVLRLSSEQAADFAAIHASFEGGDRDVKEVVVKEEAGPPALDDEDDPFGDPEEDDPFGDPAGEKDARFEALRSSLETVGGVSVDDVSVLSAYPPERIAIMHRRLVHILSPYTFVPERQEEKLKVIRDIRKRIDNKYGALEEKTRAEVDEWRSYLAVDKPITLSSLPRWIRDQFAESSSGDSVDDLENADAWGRFIVIRNGGSKLDYHNAKMLSDAFLQLQVDGKEVPVGANYFVMPEIIDTIEAEGPLVVELVLFAMLLFAIVLFRSLLGASVILLTVGAAVLGLIGVMIFLGWKANFFNLIAIPLLLGMGQDDALHIYHRYKDEGPGRLGRVIRETGGAIFLTTLTTCVGFSAILFSNHQGLLSLAQVAIMGMVLCLVASVILLPAALLVFEALRWKKEAEK